MVALYRPNSVNHVAFWWCDVLCNFLWSGLVISSSAFLSFISSHSPPPPWSIMKHQWWRLQCLEIMTCLTLFAMMAWSWSARYQIFYLQTSGNMKNLSNIIHHFPADLSHLGEDFPSRITTMLVLWLCKVTGISQVVKCCHCGRLSSPKPNSILPKPYCICGSPCLDG